MATVSTDSPTREHRMVVAAIAAGVVCVIAAVVALVVLAGNDNRPPAGVGPTGTVRQFLTLSAGENNGYQACRYLTTQEMSNAALAAGETSSCSAGFDSVSLTFGGKVYNANDLKALKYTSVEDHGTATVTVSAGGATRRFRLVPATTAELNEFAAPLSHWRIDQGASALLGA
jgi:hypothetical protein